MKIEERIQRALEGLLSQAELRSLQQDIVQDAALRRAYVDAAWLHGALRAAGPALPHILADGEQLPVVAKRTPWLWTAAAAAVAAIAVFAWASLHSESGPVAELVQAAGCKWSGSELPTVEHAPLGAGRLALVEGIATLRFASGATVTMEAPTTLDLFTAMQCRLIEGTVTAEVPESAHGFAIHTPDIKVVDLGTRFGVTASATGQTQVRVFEGEVEIESPQKAKPERVTAGKGYHVDGSRPGQELEAYHQLPIQELGGWTMVSTAFGAGKDAFVRREQSQPLGSEPLMIVKHTDLPTGAKNERRGILSFDLSQVDTQSISEAQLVLDPEPSGFGFSSLVPDSHFIVYALPDPADAWSEAQLTWSALPSCDDAGVIAGEARVVAEFSMPRGASGNALIVRSTALAEAIKSDRNHQLTLLLLRTTGETDTSGLAHGFATKEHPTARPPTLCLK